MEIGIVGQGFVGNAVFQKFKKFYNILTFDLDSSKCNSTKDEVYSCEYVFLCLPTPMNGDGSCHIGFIESVLEELDDLGDYKTVVVKSTVIPGTTRDFNEKFKNLDVVFNPEFLTERNAVEDYNNQTRIILGGPRPATTLLRQIFGKVFPTADIVKTDSTHAEMVKYLTNTFLSTKVSFANEMYQICEKLDIDYDKVIEYSVYDTRLGHSHWNVPGPDGDFGYGGHCFPKDVKALISLSEDMGITPLMLSATDVKNDSVRKNRDWEQMKGRATL